ncbi:MAG TPA: CDP-glycerol glycerophosphotransferase family protein [Candidatus Paceibacterota bacterium]
MNPVEKKKKTIFISVSAPHIMRSMLILPGSVLERLISSGVLVVLLVPKETHQKMQEDFEGENVLVEPIEVELRVKKFSKKLYNFFATYLIFTEGARLFAWHGIRLDKPVAGGKRGRLLFPLKWLIANSFGKWRWFKLALMPRIGLLIYRERPHRELFERYHPDLVYLPDVLSIQDVSVLREAKRQNIQTLGMPGSWDHLPKRFEPFHVDELLVWAEPFKKEAVELQGYVEGDVSIVGIPQYDLFARTEYLLSREEFFKMFELDPARKIIALFSSGFYMPDDGDIADIIMSEMKEGKSLSEAQLFIRPYPAMPDEHKKFDVFADKPRVYLDWVAPQKVFPHKGNRWYPSTDGLIHLMNLMYHADVIISTYSSVNVEASAFLKPIININFDGYQIRPFSQSIKRFKHLSHYKHVLETGGVRNVNSKEELLESIREFLKNPNANRERVLTLQKKLCSTLDGKASERVVAHIFKTLGEV